MVQTDVVKAEVKRTLSVSNFNGKTNFTEDEMKAIAEAIVKAIELYDRQNQS